MGILFSASVHLVDPGDVASGHSVLVVRFDQPFAVLGDHGQGAAVLGESVVAVQHDRVVVERGDQQVLVGGEESELRFHACEERMRS